jgi:hypothetical protein
LLFLTCYYTMFRSREVKFVNHVARTGRKDVRFEIFTAMTMKNAVFWDMAPCRYFVNRRFGQTYHLHLQVALYSYLLTLVHRSWISSTLKMEAIRSSETSVNKISTRPHIPEDGILHNGKRSLRRYWHRCWNNIKMDLEGESLRGYGLD